MMNNRVYFLAMLLTLLLNSCSTYNAQYQVPVPKDSAKEYQFKMQASRHWQIVADDIAAQSQTSLDKHNLKNIPLSITTPEEESDFTKALNNFLISSLVNKGLKVRETGDSNLQLKHEIQVVEFKANRTNRRDTNYSPGQYTATSLGLSILDNAVVKWSRDSWVIGSAIVGAGLDVAQIDRLRDESNIKVPNVEIIVNSSLVKDNQYVMRKSDIYYINEDDFKLFKGIKKSFPSKTLNVVNRCGDKDCKK